jgi:hypothetical protein
MADKTVIKIGRGFQGTLNIYLGGGTLAAATVSATVPPSDLRSRPPAPSPQIDVGTSNLTDPNDNDQSVGTVFVYKSSDEVYVEHWVITKPSFLGGKGEVAIEWIRPAQPWPNERQAILALNPSGARHAEMECTYKQSPVGLPDKNPDATSAKLFHVNNGFTLPLNKQGELFREIAADEFVDHWRLWADYKKPGAIFGMGGSRTELKEQPDPGSLEDFHNRNLNDGGSYVRVRYRWEDLP